jgi:PAS domain S-box-containing protein
MAPIFTLISDKTYIDLPQGLAGWLGLVVLFGVILFLLWKWHKFDRAFGRNEWVVFILLLLLTPLTSLFIGLRFSSSGALPVTGLPEDPVAPAIMIFAATPWMLAATLLGPTPATALAFLAGILAANWQTHDIFTPFELALVAVCLGAAIRQRYRTPVYRLLRHPLAAAILMALLFPFIHLLIAPFIVKGLLVTRLDYAVTNLRGISVMVGVELVIAGLIAELVLIMAPASWKLPAATQPSPAERSLQNRFVVSMMPLALALIVTLMIGDWYVSGQVARNLLEVQMANTSRMAAENVPYFLEIGQNLIAGMANNPGLLEDDPAALADVLAEEIKTVPYFNQLIVINEAGQSLASYPDSYATDSQTPVNEQMGIEMALNGVPYQIFTIPPAPGQDTAQASFVAAIFDQDNKPQRVLIGRSSLATNPFTQPMLTGLNNMAGIDGQGILIDENARILIHSDPDMVMTTYEGEMGNTPMFYDDTAPDGSRTLVYYQPAVGRPWAVVMIIPAYRAQQIALAIAAPLLGMIAILSLLAVIVIRLALSVVTRSLQKLADEAGRLAEGRLDRPVTVDSLDEVGQLGRAFEQMRVSLKARLDELNQLLLVSQGVASSLEVSEAVQPVLESALATGASSARVVLTPAVVPELDGDSSTPVSFGAGPSQNLYRDLDEQVLALTRQQDRLVLSNLYRPRLLNIAPGAPRPESLMAVALKHENHYYGTLWTAYDQPHSFFEEEVRFMVTLGGQAALAAANARLFLNAEIGRKRLESILASSPDPVLVTDQRDRLLLANPAAWQVLGLSMEADDGQPIEQVISERELVDLLHSSSSEKQSCEVTLPGGRVYLATATPVLAEGQRVGRVCVLRDVTHFKELDALKSEFVSTVSHDLRSPLTLMRGYATMLEMVGQLNDQQTSYVRKIVGGVETMSRLVNNLLDLGRIEAGVGLQLDIVSIDEVIERVVSGLQLQAAQKRIQITTDLQPGVKIQADQALLQQALHNLVENAVKYTRAEGRVHVRMQVQTIGVIFQVIDNGIGVAPMDMPHLFERFYRGAQQAAKEQRGTGLGLAIVKSIAERHGGRVWAESQLGKGSTFYLSIPLKQP